MIATALSVNGRMLFSPFLLPGKPLAGLSSFPSVFDRKFMLRYSVSNPTHTNGIAILVFERS
ncbi:hypothetical protein BBO01nite_25070 [Brevibacillus borstelensis]|jgi:hypothetical protein|nr:hypothetical protein BBO01nite_25070 [Brevibacillus borstelensis]